MASRVSRVSSSFTRDDSRLTYASKASRVEMTDPNHMPLKMWMQERSHYHLTLRDVLAVRLRAIS